MYVCTYISICTLCHICCTHSTVWSYVCRETGKKVQASTHEADTSSSPRVYTIWSYVHMDICMCRLRRHLNLASTHHFVFKVMLVVGGGRGREALVAQVAVPALHAVVAPSCNGGLPTGVTGSALVKVL